MKFHSLMAVLLLPLLLLPMSGSGATPLPPGADAAAASTSPAADAQPLDGWVYRNGDLVLDIRDAAGAEILRVGLAYFFDDDHIATANEAPAAPAGALGSPQPQPVTMPGAQAAHDAAVQAELPEPLPLGLLGAGLVVLGWTRRQGGQAAAGSWRQRLGRAIWPWPSLSWLDS